jgi:tRNA dimethylallyltransferase
VARESGGEIVSVDSMQVYREMDIGTAKPTPQMRRQVPHHLIDLADPAADFPVALLQQHGRAALRQIDSKGSIAIICGGSGLHFRSLVDPLEFPPSDEATRADLEALEAAEARRRLESLDTAAGRHVDLANPRRVVRALEVAKLTGQTPSQRAAGDDAVAVREYQSVREFVGIGIDPGDALPGRVTARFDAMLRDGLLEEVAGLRGRLGRLARQAVGYKELLPVVAGEITLEQGRDAAVRASMALAKRQRTFFRRDPRIKWITWDPDPAVLLGRVEEHVQEVVA